MRAFQKQAAPNTPVTNSPGLSEREGQSPDPPASSSCCHRSSKSSWSVSLTPTPAGSRVRPAERSHQGCSHLTNPSLILLPTNHLCKEKLVLRARPVPRDIPNMPSQCPSQDVPGCWDGSSSFPALVNTPAAAQHPAEPCPKPWPRQAQGKGEEVGRQDMEKDARPPGLAQASLDESFQRSSLLT